MKIVFCSAKDRFKNCFNGTVKRITIKSYYFCIVSHCRRTTRFELYYLVLHCFAQPPHPRARTHTKSCIGKTNTPALSYCFWIYLGPVTMSACRSLYPPDRQSSVHYELAGGRARGGLPALYLSHKGRPRVDRYGLRHTCIRLQICWAGSYGRSAYVTKNYFFL